MKKRIVLALGGNALQKNGEATAEAQKKIAIEVGNKIAELADKYEIIVAHGNGPQPARILCPRNSHSTHLLHMLALSYWLPSITRDLNDRINMRGFS